MILLKLKNTAFYGYNLNKIKIIDLLIRTGIVINEFRSTLS
jgi:hypothetical protein